MRIVGLAIHRASDFGWRRSGAVTSAAARADDSAAARAGDSAAARAIVDEAIRAHGGEAALAKWPVVTVKTEGIFHGHETHAGVFFQGRDDDSRGGAVSHGP